jgi:DNA-binding transcriptional ArsR family regulator
MAMRRDLPVVPKASVRRRTAANSPGRANRNARQSADDLHAVFDAVARYFSLLAEPTRLRILHAICQSEQSVTAIVAATGATQTNVSRHLALLFRAGVVLRRREGNTVYYAVADPDFVSICRTVCVRIAGGIDASQPLKRDLLGFAAQVR